MKSLIYIVSGTVALGLVYHVFNANLVRLEMAKQFTALTSEFIQLEDNNKKIQGELEYLSDPHNLEKELRAKFNYRAPNEKMIIVVPPGE